MNLDYISGFFDADGSISIGYDSKKSKYRSRIKIDFTNTKLSILLEIQKFFLNNYNIKLFLSTKPARKENHLTSYTLSTSSSQKSLEICKLLNSYHPIKLHRINTVLKYHNKVTKRNGKYTEKDIIKKLAYERLFFCSIFQ